MLDVSDADLTAHTCPEASIQLHELIKDSDTTIQLQLFHRLSNGQVPFCSRFGSLSTYIYGRNGVSEQFM